MTRRLVVDNSVVMSWCFEDEKSDYADGVLSTLIDHEALVPLIWPLEVANVLLVAERRRRLSPANALRFLGLLRSLPIVVEGESLDQTWGEILTLARETGLSTYDASYLNLAIREGVPLATQDSALRRAARKVKVSIAELE
jgi:predicted nucleic acid-binding protein